MTIFPASLTSLICKTPFAMTSHNGPLIAQAKAAICNDVSRPICCVRIRSFSSLTFPVHQATTVTAIMVNLHIRILSRYFLAFSSAFCTILCFCSLLYDALWPEQFPLWLWLGRDALWPEQFTKSRHTPFCFLRNANTEARDCYATRDYMCGGD